MLFSLFLWCVPLVALWGSECNAGKEEEHYPALFSHASRTGRWRNGSLPRCVIAAVHTQVCGFGACFWCLFALLCSSFCLRCSFTAGTCCMSLFSVAGARWRLWTRVYAGVVASEQRWKGCFFLGCAGIVVVIWFMCVQTRVWAEGGIFGDGWPGGRSCCSLQSGTNSLVSPLKCQWSTGCLDKLFILGQRQQSACWGRRLYFVIKGGTGICDFICLNMYSWNEFLKWK